MLFFLLIIQCYKKSKIILQRIIDNLDEVLNSGYIYKLHFYITDIKSIRNSIEILFISISRIVHSKSPVKQYISQHWDHVERPDDFASC